MAGLPAELVALGDGYDRIVDEVTSGRMTPTDALAELAANQIVDGAGVVWAYDQTGQLTRTPPGAGPTPSEGGEWVPAAPVADLPSASTPSAANPFAATPAAPASDANPFAAAPAPPAEPSNPFGAAGSPARPVAENVSLFDASPEPFPTPPVAQPPRDLFSEQPVPASPFDTAPTSPFDTAGAPAAPVDDLLLPPLEPTAQTQAPPWARSGTPASAAVGNPNFPHPAGPDLLTPPDRDDTDDDDSGSGRKLPKLSTAALPGNVGAFIKRNLAMVVVSAIGVLLLVAAVIISTSEPEPQNPSAAATGLPTDTVTSAVTAYSTNAIPAATQATATDVSPAAVTKAVTWFSGQVSAGAKIAPTDATLTADNTSATQTWIVTGADGATTGSVPVTWVRTSSGWLLANAPATP